MQIDIRIDKLTDCLVERETGIVVETEYEEHTKPMKKNEYADWNFDWSKTQKNGYKVCELFIKGNPAVQGRVSFRIDGGVAEVDIVESAPHNVGNRGKYIGVGGHLFAIACQASLETGNNGVIAFTSKTDLVKHYKKELGAVEIMPRRMVVFEEAARILLDKYIRK